jgi:23S rRNA pseudouridine2605 synthase
VKTTEKAGGVRINRYLSLCGLGARRDVEALVRAGRVKVNRSPVADLATRVPDGARVEVDGRLVAPRRSFRYVAYYKERGVLTTCRDPFRRRTLVMEVPPALRDLKPVGRLDADTEGLIILTDDGAFAHRVAHPAFNVPKRYEAEVVGTVTRADRAAIQGGIRLLDGHIGKARVDNVGRTPAGSRVTLTVTYGRKRMLRQLLTARGHKVLSLRRLAIGAVSGAGLKPGGWRDLTPAEVASLRDDR